MSTINTIDFSSRLSIRAVTAGGLVSVASTFLLMTIAAAFGVWNMNLMQVSDLGFGFWAWGFGSWIVSTFVGSYVAAMISRSSTRLDGLLHGVTIWAGTCVLGYTGLALATGRFFQFLGENASQGLIWSAVGGNVLALLASLYGGYLGANYESRVEARELPQITPQQRPPVIPRAVG